MRGLTRLDELQFLREHQISYGPCLIEADASAVKRTRDVARAAVKQGFYHPMARITADTPEE